MVFAFLPLRKGHRWRGEWAGVWWHRDHPNEDKPESRTRQGIHTENYVQDTAEEESTSFGQLVGCRREWGPGPGLESGGTGRC